MAKYQAKLGLVFGAILVLLASTLFLLGCGSQQAPTSSSPSSMADAAGSEHSTSDQAKAANAASDADTPSTSSSSSGSNTPYTVDYGTSKVYSKADIDAAIQVVMAEFDTWKGATMKYIGYTNDDDSIHDIEYAVRLGVDIDPSYTQSIILTSYFHSPSGKDAEGTAWDPDKDYNDWLWHLVRADGGDWKLLTWGYV